MFLHFQVKFKCKICGFLYSRKDTLKDHIRGKHNPRYSTTDLNSLVEVVPPSNGAAPSMKMENGRKNSDRKPGVPGALGGPDPGAGVGPGDCTTQKPGTGGFLL